MNKLIDLIKNAHMIWIVGNGGSASTAEHFTTDLVKKGYRAICLNSNVSVLTMLSNDYGYKYIFGKQLEIYGVFADLLITISCSGTSPNILNAQAVAKQKDMSIYKFETFGRIKDYGKLEDKHLKFTHKVAKAL